MSMIDFVMKATNEYIEHMPKNQRKKYGQFFTSKETATFMAGLFDDIPREKSEVSILDPGAGSGVLSVALIERLQMIPHLKRISLTCYENDPNILDLLRSNLDWVRAKSAVSIEYEIVFGNYILEQMEDYNFMLGANLEPKKFDFVIGNPPYMKVSKDAPEAMAMQDICYGAPNLYFLFASMSMFNLKDGGELVYITPRSWTSGVYFKRFRQKFLNEGALAHIHLFVRRNSVFEKESVLQETIIFKARKTPNKPKHITITKTQSNVDFSDKTVFEAPYNTVINGNDCYIYPVTNAEEAETLDKLNRWENTLPSIGLRMKTGLTVDFRNWEALRNNKEDQAVPLFYAQHIRDGKIVFPIGKGYEYIVTEQNGLRQKNSNYLFIKRFTAKEEPRRLQCGVYLAKRYPEYTEISTQNKINFICGLRELSEYAVYGLYVLFNSTLYDDYYRILNGSTQVNSTEVNSMPVPPISIIEELGRELLQIRDMSEASCDSILRSYDMRKIMEAKNILNALQVPPKQQNTMCACVLLAMASIKEDDNWTNATNGWIRIHDIIAFSNGNYGTTYAENSRETFRKQAIHHFRNAAFIEDNGKATNSPHYRYRLTDEMLALIQSYGTVNWEAAKQDFLSAHETLVNLYASKRAMRKMPVRINGGDFTFSPGKHNELQKAIIEEFAPRFAPDSECLYVGDTTEKDLVKNEDKLRELGFTITMHDKMPDIVLYSSKKNWLFFVESVTSVGPMEPKRIKELEEMTEGVVAEKIYVTAFPDFKTFKKFADSLAWETEVWIEDMPDHMIHMNGDKFLGPRKN